MKKPLTIAIFTSLLVLCFATKGMAQDVSNKSYPYEPASKTNTDMTKGEVLKFEYKNSKIYPGTSRSYWVYIPAAYKPSTPACLFVCMDGVLFNAPDVFDNLISTGEMPITIGVFIESGTIMKNNNTVLRYNRTNEFDNLNNRFSRFITEEILPDVEKKTASDGRAINISPNANDHAIAGASSGAICAFTAAWQRPDVFSRVFSCIGTYVGMRGGDQYPVLVRKTEPKPLRVYLQDNNNDTWNPLFGNWFKANIDMEAALNFAGYEVTNTWNEGGHDGKQATAIFPDAMRWLWKGWPQPVKAGWSANNMLSTILVEHDTWQPVKTSFDIAGKIAPMADGEIVVSDTLGDIYKIDNSANAAMLKKQETHTGFITVDAFGNIYTSDKLSRKIYRGNTKDKKALQGEDVLVMPNGDKYIAKPAKNDDEEGTIILQKADGSIQVVDEDKYIGYALAVSPDKGQLIVSKKNSHWLYSYVIQQDGTLADKQTVYWLHNLANEETEEMTSMAFDDHGNLYVATKAGVQVCDQNGRVRAILDLPGGAVTSVCLGGENFDTLYVVCNGKLYKRKLKVHGQPSWKEAMKPIDQGAG